MSVRSVPRRATWAPVAVSAIAALLLASSSIAAATSCREVSGEFSLQSSTQSCRSPVGICTTGSFKGGLIGKSVFTGTSLMPTVDTPITSVVVLTGDNRIQTATGTLTTKDAIVVQTSETSAGDFAEVDTIIGGTGQWAGATGSIIAVGTFTGASFEGTYAGQICTP